MTDKDPTTALHDRLGDVQFQIDDRFAELTTELQALRRTIAAAVWLQLKLSVDYQTEDIGKRLTATAKATIASALEPDQS